MSSEELRISELDEKTLKKLLKKATPTEKQYLLELYEDYKDDYVQTYKVIYGDIREIEIERYYTGNTEQYTRKVLIIPLTKPVIIEIQENSTITEVLIFTGEGGWKRVYVSH